MALETNRYYLTDRGNELLHRALGGTVLQLTSVKLGGGTTAGRGRRCARDDKAHRGGAGF